MDIAPNKAPTDKDPVSPIKTRAGGALYQRKPRPAPINAPIKMVISPAFGTW